MIYKLDYSQANPQAGSRLCQIPDDILLEIAKENLFAGFGLEFCTQVDNDCKCQQATIGPPSTFDKCNLKLLRSCKILCAKLLPSLAASMGGSLVTFYSHGWPLPSHFSPPYKAFTARNYTARLVRNAELSPLFCSRVWKLELSTGTDFLLDPALFPNLAEVRIHQHAPIIFMGTTVNREVLLLLTSRRAIGESLNAVEDSAVRRVCFSAPRRVRQCRWIIELIKYLKSSELRQDVRVFLMHRLLHMPRLGSMGDHKWFILVHDITTDIVTLLTKPEVLHQKIARADWRRFQRPMAIDDTDTTAAAE